MESSIYKEENPDKKLDYLKANIFYGLKNRNDGFDSKSIYYFSESDFKIVLGRVEKNELGIYGIEPWQKRNLYDVLGCDDFNTVSTDPNWYRKAFSEFKKSGEELLYSATYEIPKKLL